MSAFLHRKLRLTPDECNVVISNSGQRNFVNEKFTLLYKVKKYVKRTFEYFSFNFKLHWTIIAQKTSSSALLCQFISLIREADGRSNFCYLQFGTRSSFLASFAQNFSNSIFIRGNMLTFFSKWGNKAGNIGNKRVLQVLIFSLFIFVKIGKSHLGAK